jgi:translocation and assembly module TamB
MGNLPPNFDRSVPTEDAHPTSDPTDRSTNLLSDSPLDRQRPNWVATATKVTVGLVGVSLLGFIGASIWVATNLSPTIARELTRTLDRQIAIGPVENIGFNQINFGASTLAANAESPNKIAVKAIKISFDPLAILWQRTIKPSITLVEPDLYLEQDAKGDWLRLKLPPATPSKPGELRTEIQGIQVQKARGTIIPFQANGLRQPIEFQDTDFNANFSHRDRTLQLIDFNGKSQIGKDAKLSLQGSTSPVDRTTNLEINGQSLNAKQVSDFVKIPAVDFRSGLVGGNLNLNLRPNQPPQVTGNVRVAGAAIQVIQVPQLFTNTSGDLQISPQEVKLNNVATIYGKIPGQISGAIDFTKGYDLRAKIPALPVGQLLENLQIKAPVPITAQVQTDLSLTGKLREPVLAGRVKSNGVAQIDRTAFKQIQGDFALTDGKVLLSDISALPTSGGAITANGEIALNTLTVAPPSIKLNLRGKKLVADVLAQPYQKLPIALGVVDTNVQVTGNVGQLNTNIRVEAPQATYPLTAQIGIAPSGVINVNQAKVKLAGYDLLGSGQLNQGRWQARLQVPAIPSQRLAAIANVKDFPKFLLGNVQGDLQLSGSIEDSTNLSGKGKLQLQTAGGKIEATNFALNQGKWQAELQTSGLVLAKIDPQLPGQMTGKFRVSGDLAKPQPESLLAVGSGSISLSDGKITGQNLRLTEGKWQGDFSADSFDISQMAPQVGGKLSGKVQASGDVSKLDPAGIVATGTATLASAQGKIIGQNLRLADGKWQGDFNADNFDLVKVAPQIGGKLSGKFQANGDLQKSNLQDIVASGTGALRLGAGELVGKNLQLSQGNWQGNIVMTKVPLGRLSPLIPKPFQGGLLNGNLQAFGSIDQPTKVQIKGDASVNLAGGQISAKGLQIGDNRWQGLFTLKSLDLQQLSLPKNIPAGQVDGTFELAGILDQPKLETAKGSGRMRLSGAEIVADRLELTGDQWQGAFKTTNLSVGKFTSLPPALSGVKVSSNFDLSGNLKNPQQLTGGGSGRVLLGNSEVALQRWQFDKGRWQVAANTKGLRLGTFGSILPSNLQAGVFKGNVELSGAIDKPQITALNGRVAGELSIWGGSIAVSPLQIADGRWQSESITLRDINLNSIAGNQIKNVDGRISGNAKAAGRLDRFDINDLQVDSQLQLNGKVAMLPATNIGGGMKIANGKIDLDLAGGNDLLSLHSTKQGLTFAGKLAGMESEGEIDGVQLKMAARGIPIPLITSFLPPIPQLKKQELQGILAGSLTMNLLTGEIEGENLSIDNPQIGILKGDRLQSGSVKYADGNLIVRDGKFSRGDNVYLLEGRVLTKSRQPSYNLAVIVQKGQLDDVINLFQIFSLEDVLNPFGDRGYGTANDLSPHAVGGELSSLQEHIERLTEIRRLQDIRTAKNDENPIPDLRNLKGNFAGKIVLSSGSKQGVFADFDITGDDWMVDKYSLLKVDLHGRWQSNVLLLRDFSLLSTNSQIKLNGEFSMDRQSADIQIDRFPAERLSSLFRLPIDIAGDVDIKAHLGGTWFDPQLSGSGTISNGKLNQSDVPAIYTDFNYNNARLGFNSVFKDSTALPNSENEPMRIAGSVPYQLPFALKPPDNQNFVVNMRIQNEGMQTLAILTQQQLNWVSGNGQINVLLKGKIDALGKAIDVTAKGEATVVNGVLQAAALPQTQNNLIDVNGQVNFDLDRVKFDKLRGKYGNGEILADGSISIEKSLNLTDPLTITLDKLQLDLKDKYQGGIDGSLLLGNGTLLAPRLGGSIKLSNGKIFLPETSNTSDGKGSPEAGSMEFQNLELTLGDNVQVEKAPVLSFFATGTVKLNGSIDRLRPDGTIQLGRGQINLFTNRFRLNGSGNTAQFTPERGTDPIVNLQLSTKVLETSRLPSLNSANERIDKKDLFSTDLGAAQTVQVDAKVTGPASEASSRLALTSTPNRSQDEIFLLLGNGLGSLSPDESGLLKFAGSTAINYVQDVVSDFLGLSDFRLYPALTRSEGSTTSTLGLAAELGVDINKSVSASVLKVLTSPELPQFSIRYRINDRILLRGSSNLFNDSRAIIEYEQRF